MRNPLWIINSGLLVLLICTILLLVISKTRVPSREEIEPDISASYPTQPKVVEINLKNIYENDLFATYRPDIAAPEQMAALPVPTLPRDQIVKVPKTPEPHFLEPLNITLKGIVFMHHDNSFNRAIFSNNKTGREEIYAIGDLIDDAQLVAIFKTKTVFLRTNGQQEILYLREQDAHMDSTFMKPEPWDLVITTQGDNRFLLDVQEFFKKIQTLAQFIDTLGLTTVYKQGKNIGCRIGLMLEKSFGDHLGLKTGDIITTINGIEATTTENRFRIYKEIIEKASDETQKEPIHINLQRRGNDFSIDISLHNHLKKSPTPHDTRGAWQKDVTRPVSDQRKNDETDIVRNREAQLFTSIIDSMHAYEQQMALQNGSL